MCMNYWNADACRQCGAVSNLVAPGKKDARTGLKNTQGSMCIWAQMQKNRPSQHADRPLHAANFCRFQKRTLCDDYEPGLNGNKGTRDYRLTYLWGICSSECKRKHAAYVPQSSSPLKRRLLETDADDSEEEEAAEKKSPGKSYSKLSSAAGRLKKMPSMRDEVLKCNFRSDLESRGIRLVDDDTSEDGDTASEGDKDDSQDDDEPPRKKVCAQLPNLEDEEEEEDDGTF
ncbi:hypothetical protein KJ359_009332 [Pestalotiopsis sp. 9143b]|nr:hypothetical protein KJ359_009332 [Pestalotiopsis sp. 9143b]